MNYETGHDKPGVGDRFRIVLSDTQANATTGTLTFTTPATVTSNVGQYAINGSGLVANNGNYTFRVRACIGSFADASCGAFAARSIRTSISRAC